jgi:starch synthase
VTTVSPSYLEELRHSANGMEKLFEYEQGKCSGILNGIDAEVWNPSSDPLLVRQYQAVDLKAGKQSNKEELCRQFGLNPNRPLITFIGRLVNEKAADLLPESIHQLMHLFADRFSMILLGSGNPELESTLHQLSQRYSGRFGAYIGYYETLSHRLYAGADFLLMPSRVEPCGLNQLYAMRYGTVPLVRSTGGLKDTVVDMGDEQGIGIRFDQSSVADIVYSVGRALELYEHHAPHMHTMQVRMMGLDHSWDRSANAYLELYQSIL